MIVDSKKLYQVFNLGPLEVGQLESLYVDLCDVRGESEPGSVVAYLGDSIRLSDRHTCQLVTGHQGSGKSTEMRRLKKALQQGDERYFAVICDIEGELALDDTDFPDLLLAMVRQLADALHESFAMELKPGYFATRWNELKGLLGSEVGFEKAELTVGLAKIVGVLRSSPDSRKPIRDALEPRVDSLLHAANELFDQAREQLKPFGFKDIVLLVDGTDKLKLGTGNDAGTLPGERLFIRRHDQTSGFACHVCYAIPMALNYSVQNDTLAGLYDQQIPVVPVTKLQDRQAHLIDAAYVKFREMIEKRVVFCGSTMDGVFADEKVVRELIRLSAGQPRELCILIRDCLRADLPIHSATVELVARRATMAFAQWLEAPHWRMIKEYRSGRQPLQESENRDTLRDLIAGRAILHYRNHEQWLAVNPLVGETPEGI